MAILCVSALDVAASAAPHASTQQLLQATYFVLYTALLGLWGHRVGWLHTPLTVAVVIGHALVCAGVAMLLEPNVQYQLVYPGFLFCMTGAGLWALAFWLPTVSASSLDHPAIDASWAAGV